MEAWLLAYSHIWGSLLGKVLYFHGNRLVQRTIWCRSNIYKQSFSVIGDHITKFTATLQTHLKNWAKTVNKRALIHTNPSFCHQVSPKGLCRSLLTKPKPLTVWITTNWGKFWKRWEYQTIWPASWETYIQVRKQQLELDMEQQTGSKSGKEYVKSVYHPAYLTYMQSSSCKMPS